MADFLLGLGHVTKSCFVGLNEILNFLQSKLSFCSFLKSYK